VEVPPPLQRPPEQSVYYDPQFNPLGTPPPGYPEMYREVQHSQVNPPTHFTIPPSQVHSQVLPPPTSFSLPNYGYLNSLYVARPSVLPPPQVVFNPYPSTSSHRIENKSFVDPLDPSSSGYNQRFGTEGQKRKRQVLEAPDHHKDLGTELPDQTPVVENTPTPIGKLELDPMQSVDVSPQVLEVESQIPSINIAELMKRRKMIHLESEEVAGPTLPPEVVGPTRPNREESQPAPEMTSILGICYSSDSESEEVVPEPTNQNHISLPAADTHLSSSDVLDPAHVNVPKSDVFTEVLPPKPKQIRVESELVHFVPSTLRAKRTYPQSKSKSQSQPLMSDDPSPIMMPVKQMNDSVDAAYEEFMSEINQLGH
jgi:hypothetical protein